jgi:hypothetical protein
VPGLHGGDGRAEHRHLRVNLVHVYIGQEGGGPARVGGAVGEAAFLVAGRQELVLEAAAVGGRQVGLASCWVR